MTIGQCGFGFAPTKPDDRDLNMRMMNRIEAIPLESMRLGMRWDWETFPEYLKSLDSQGLGVNVGALVPFSPVRGYVLGMIPSRERTSVTEAELNQMKQIMYDGMKAGAFGISADKNMEDRPEDGSFLPSHVASSEEFLAMAEVMGDVGVTRITTNLWGDRWSKLAINCMSNALAAITGLKSAELRENPEARGVSIAIAAELLTVAGGLGVSVEPISGVSADLFLAAATDGGAREEVEQKMIEAGRTIGSGRPSLAQDIAKGRKTEAEHLNGYVVRRAIEVGVSTPVNRAVVELIGRIETGDLQASLSNLSYIDR